MRHRESCALRPFDDGCRFDIQQWQDDRVTPGFVVYIAIVSLTIAFALRAAGRLNRALVRRGRRGFLGFDRRVTSEYAESPIRAWRDGALTEQFRLLFSRVTDDPELDQLRRSCLAWDAVAVVAVFAGLALI